MHQHHYDIIFLGDSLASRLAAVLLAKAGKKVLIFRLNPPPLTPWLFNSIHLGHVLDQLGGRNCLTSPRKLQVITSQSRLELHGTLPLSDELRREFPSSHQQVADLLQALEALGNRFESQIWTSGGLALFDRSGSLRFRWKLLFSRPGFRTLGKSLACLLDEITAPAPRACLEALFNGLAMAPTSCLTIGEGALLWSSACQTQGISRAALDDLLQRRYEQFHGCNEPLDAIKEIGKDGRIELQNSRFCSAGVLVIGSSAATDLLAENTQHRYKTTPPACRWQSTPVAMGISPFLASRIILAEPHPLRVTLAPTPTGTVCITECRSSAGGTPPTGEELDAQLAGILPFANVSLSPTMPQESTKADLPWPKVSGFPGTAQRLRLKKNLLLGCGKAALPYLGSTGEIITGVGLARYLMRADKQQA